MAKKKKAARISWTEVKARLRALPLARPLLLLTVCTVAAMLMTDYVRMPEQDFGVGDVAPYDFWAPTTFTFEDDETTAKRKQEASDAVLQVYDLDVTMGAKLQNRVSLAFDAARRKLQGASQVVEGEETLPPDVETLAIIANEFLASLEADLEQDHLLALTEVGFSTPVEALTNEFIGVAMRRNIVADRSMVPSGGRPIAVMRLSSDSRQEVLLEDMRDVVTLEQARHDLAAYAYSHDESAGGAAADRAAAAIASKTLRTNFDPNALLTEKRRQKASGEVPPVEMVVKEGTILFRDGDVLTQRQIRMYEELRQSQSSANTAAVVLSLLAFCTIVLSTFYVFGANYMSKFAVRMRSLYAMAFLLLLLLGAARIAMEFGAVVFANTGMGPMPSSFWYIVPLAGGAMLVRILANGDTALVFAVVVSLLVGVMMDQQVFYALFFLLSSAAAAGGISQTQERAQVLRAGLQTAVVNAAVVLLIELLRLHLTDAGSISLRVLAWDMVFAALGGLISAVMVLGLVPLFEMFGFVTDYKLLELANLNHPLLRQLMLRAPGTYHHSVSVGLLSEAAAEAIGADKLSVRVASYFHDIGKVSKPQFFVENQRDIANPHDRMPPRKSASLIIRHVRSGARIAAHNRLPQPVIDNIRMHHGTGLVKYFFDKAQQLAGPDERVDENDYRYPGPLPNTREAGILHLADKVEAACRAIKNPTPEKFRDMIQKLMSAAMNDGQLEDCALTLKDLYTIGKSFSDVLMSIYHHRIEYPDSPPTQESTDGAVGSRAGSSATGSVITLEIQNPLGPRADELLEARAPDPDDDVLPGDEWDEESSVVLRKEEPAAEE